MPNILHQGIFKKQIAILGILILVSFSIWSQDKKPKVALVLSGGGAKGVAHIPVLQKLDSLGIVPDIVIGTSMGSVIGGLYAIGYSGDSIAQITFKADWANILGGFVSLQEVGVEEKSEFGRYLINLDIINGKPKVKSSILKDQNLREFLSSLLYPVYDIQNFDDFPIPFRSVTTDLVNGNEVVLSEGSIGLAIRASMSIPSIFEPVRYKGTLLVDGGVVNNFPVDVAKRLGADIIIGSDVGSGLQPIEKLDNVATILFQTSMLTSNLKNPSNRALCDILIDHSKNLTYATKDFVKSKEKYDEGLIATNENLQKLSELANQLKRYSQRTHELKKIPDEIVFDDFEYYDISPQNLSLVKARMDLEPYKKYGFIDIKKAIDRAMGTELFEQIIYEVKFINNQVILKLTGYEKAQKQFNGALHYDSFQGVGLIVNFTGRNIISNASRVLVGLDIAEQPKFRLQYQQNFGSSRTWWWRTEIFGEKALQKYFFNGNNGDKLKNNYFRSNLQFNRDLNPLISFVGFDLDYHFTGVKPQLDPRINNNVYDLRHYSFNNFEISAYYIHNSLNSVFYPINGTYLETRISRSLYNKVTAEFVENSNNNVSGNINGFTKINFDYEKRVLLKKGVSLITKAASGLTLIDSDNNNTLSFTENGQGAFYTLGGNLTSPRRDSYILNGLSDGELLTTQFIRLNLGLQINIWRNVYITPYANMASVGFEDTNEFFKNILSSNNNWNETAATSMLFSAGSTLSYNSILGPVNFDIAYVNSIDKLNLFFSVGLHFNIPK